MFVKYVSIRETLKCLAVTRVPSQVRCKPSPSPHGSLRKEYTEFVQCLRCCQQTRNESSDSHWLPVSRHVTTHTYRPNDDPLCPVTGRSRWDTSRTTTSRGRSVRFRAFDRVVKYQVLFSTCRRRAFEHLQTLGGRCQLP